MNSEYYFSNLIDWQQQAYQCLIQEDYSRAISLYEQAIEVEPKVTTYYWYLGLLLLLQGQETEAQTTWLLAIGESSSEEADIYTAELMQVLQTEAERREALRDYSIAWVLRQYIREINPKDINNLLHIIQISISLGNFICDELNTLGILELLRVEEYHLNVNLLLQVRQGILDLYPHELSALSFDELCQRYIHKDKKIDASLVKTKSKYSYLDEENIIEEYLKKINANNQFCVDIAASDGITMSNTYFLFEKGWAGLAVEGNSNKFAKLALAYTQFEKVNLSKCMVTPENVVSLLKAHRTPENFAFLNLDIDGYDYFVLEQILNTFRPFLICAEINENIPPPLKFTVKWEPDYVWAVDHFFGQSICQVNILCQRHEYEIVELHYNNIFLVPKEINSSTSLTPQEAYKKGYLERIDRHQKFPWNAVIEEIHSLSPQEALIYLNKFFSKYEGKFICTL